jgi:hypothetical protein
VGASPAVSPVPKKKKKIRTNPDRLVFTIGGSIFSTQTFVLFLKACLIHFNYLMYWLKEKSKEYNCHEVMPGGCVVGCCYPEVSSLWPPNSIDGCNAMVLSVSTIHCTSYINGGLLWFCIIRNISNSNSSVWRSSWMYLGATRKIKFCILNFRFAFCEVRFTLLVLLWYDYEWIWNVWTGPFCQLETGDDWTALHHPLLWLVLKT